MNALTHTTTKPPTISGAADPYAAYGLTGSRDGVALKFNKSGEWIAALTEGATVIPAGREFVALMEDLACAWTKWIDSKPVDRRVTLVASGVAPPLRDTLGDTTRPSGRPTTKASCGIHGRRHTSCRCWTKRAGSSSSSSPRRWAARAH
jgi:hypothetical protein